MRPASSGARLRGLLLLALACVGTTACGPGLEQTPPPSPASYSEGGGPVGEPGRLLRNAARTTYRLYVANESSDDVSRVAFEPGRGARVEKTVPVGIMPGDIDGAHGITVSPDGTRWYLSIAHGTPYGSVWQFATGSDSLMARTEAGLFPATMGITPDGSLLLAVNFNLHGDPVASNVSVISTPTMTEVARVTTCVMPHGSRVGASGDYLYSVCMGSDQVVQLDTRTFELSKRFSVRPGREGPLPLTDRGEGEMMMGSGDGGSGGSASAPSRCSPTWVEPATGIRARRVVWVACNGGGQILGVDVQRWRVESRYEVGSAPYNLEATADGRYLLATLKGGQAVAILDLDQDGKEVARIPTSEPVTHGVVASPDNRYAFVSNEAVGATRGTLDVLDLRTLERVATVRLGHQSGGIGFWEIDRLGR